MDVHRPLSRKHSCQWPHDAAGRWCGVLAGSITGPNTYIYDSHTDSWSPGPTKLYGDSNNHESWTLLPDGSILCYDVNSNPQHAQRLDTATR